MAVTAKLIAEICGVSQGSVDRAFNDRKGISPETKQKILRVAEEVGYRPHLLAKSLAKGETKTIGIVVFDLAHSFFSQLVTETILSLKSAGYFSYVSITDKDPAEEFSCLSHLSALQVDGIILVPINKGKEFNQRLKLLKTPVVTVGNSLESSAFPFVGIDDERAIHDAVVFIKGKGYRNIVYISPPLYGNTLVNEYGPVKRLKGFQRAMQKVYADSKPTIIKGDKYLKEINALIPHLIQEGKTALLCSNDHFAIRVLDLLEKRNVAIPSEIGIMGFDNIDMLTYIKPRLTTVDYRIPEIGKRVVARLLGIIQQSTDPDPAADIIEHSIVEGETI